MEEIDRWRDMLPKLKSPPIYSFFSDRERQYCQEFSDPAPHYAVRWCAKEAAFKAFSPFVQIDLRTIEIINEKDGKPICLIHDPAVAERNFLVRVSMSHSRNIATAIVAVFY